jgi:hypothetical protein
MYVCQSYYVVLSALDQRIAGDSRHSYSLEYL